MKNRTENITEKELLDYLADRLSESERNRIEKLLQTDKFGAEALDGLSLIKSEEIKTDLQNLRLNIRKSDRSSNLRYWIAAASVLLITGISIFLYMTAEKENNAILTQNQDLSEKSVKNPYEKPEQVLSDDQRVKDNAAESKGPVQPQDKTTVSEKKENTSQLKNDKLPGKTTFAQVKINDPHSAEKIVAGIKVAEQTDLKLVTDSADRKTEVVKVTTVDENETFPVLRQKGGEEMGKKSGLAKKVALPLVENETKSIPQSTVDQGDNDSLKATFTVIYPSNLARNPLPETGFDSYVNYLKKNIKIIDSTTVQTDLVLKISAAGGIDSAQVLNMQDISVVNKIKKVIINGPAWIPAYSDQKPVDSEILIRLNIMEK